ncbi:NUDIX domain-containing protein [Nonomuraea sp. NPDC050328]|uniref:NUDIX hydrolase n=1 Tax=Nonomuraea sp. NPDC050328 TaxID=3364361 RepID=UPI0037A786AF
MTTEIRAAGAVVWRGDEHAPEVALIHRPRYDDWTFPKGKAKAGEHDLACALREVQEETGFTVVLGRPLPTSHYLHLDQPKRVRYWSARVVSGDFAPGPEADDLKWVPLHQAHHRLSYDRDRALLGELLTAPLASEPLIFVRHGTAGSREAWHGPDHLRPLDARGHVQARTLAGILPAYGPGLLMSSPSLRCVQTLEPYSTDMVLEPLLSEEGMDPAKTPALVSGLTGAAVLSTHGKVLTELLGLRLEKGELAVRHRADGRVIAEERHHTA